MFGKAAIPGLMLNFLKNYRENRVYWPPLYDEHDGDFEVKSATPEPDFKDIRKVGHPTTIKRSNTLATANVHMCW